MLQGWYLNSRYTRDMKNNMEAHTYAHTHTVLARVQYEENRFSVLADRGLSKDGARGGGGRRQGGRAGGGAPRAGRGGAQARPCPGLHLAPPFRPAPGPACVPPPWPALPPPPRRSSAAAPGAHRPAPPPPLQDQAPGLAPLRRRPAPDAPRAYSAPSSLAVPRALTRSSP